METAIQRINKEYKQRLTEAKAKQPPFSDEMDSPYQRYYWEKIVPLYDEWNFAVLHQQMLDIISNARNKSCKEAVVNI